MRIVTLQPRRPGAPPTERDPLPWHVNPADGAVLRQEVWHGTPTTLVGFAANDRPASPVVLTLSGFDADPSAAVGLFPIFTSATGARCSGTRPIATVEVTNGEASA